MQTPTEVTEIAPNETEIRLDSESSDALWRLTRFLEDKLTQQ